MTQLFSLYYLFSCYGTPLLHGIPQGTKLYVFRSRSGIQGLQVLAFVMILHYIPLQFELLLNMVVTILIVQYFNLSMSSLFCWFCRQYGMKWLFFLFTAFQVWRDGLTILVSVFIWFTVTYFQFWHYSSYSGVCCVKLYPQNNR